MAELLACRTAERSGGWPGSGVTRITGFDLLAQLLRFASVGVVATVVHFAVALSLLQLGAVAQLANLLGFLIAFAVSFIGHYVWTFRSDAVVTQAVLRFFLLAAGAYCASAVTLFGLERWAPGASQLHLIMAVAVIPVTTYVVSRKYVF